MELKKQGRLDEELVSYSTRRNFTASYLEVMLLSHKTFHHCSLLRQSWHGNGSVKVQTSMPPAFTLKL